MINTTEIYSYLDCSTIHITGQDTSLLSCINHRFITEHPLLVMSTLDDEDGFMVCVSDDLEPGLSPALQDVLNYAHSKNCQWLRLSPDGHIHEDLSKYDWK